MKPSKDDMLKEHLPYRLVDLDGCRWACNIIISGKVDSKLCISFNGTDISFPYMRPLTNALVEIGILRCRVLMNFLGIKIKNKKLKTEKDKNFNITNLGLDLLEVSDLGSALPDCDAEQIERACLNVLNSASKAVAHFTVEEARPKVSDVLLCTKTILRLVEDRVYRALNLEVPKYRKWTNQGSL